jgi:hypothetical protein
MIKKLKTEYPTSPNCDQLLTAKIILARGCFVEMSINLKESKVDCNVMPGSCEKITEQINLLLKDWRQATLDEQLLNGLEMLRHCFVDPPSCECSICAEIWLNEVPATVLCDCGAIYHEECCRSWLETDPLCKRFFGTIRGSCPTCDKVKCMVSLIIVGASTP